MRSLLAKVTTVVAIVAASVVVAGQPAAAGPPSHRTPDLVALGDSFAAGTGNTPYLDQDCGRSKNAAYSERLQQVRLVTLQAFPACAGATTVTVVAQGQLDRITKDTDLVTVQALGNDYYFSLLATFCLASLEAPTCHRDQLLTPIGMTVQQLLDSIPATAPGKLDVLYGDIDQQIKKVGAKAKVIVVDYGNPFPTPTGRTSPFCPTLDKKELDVATAYADALNKALKQAARKWHFTFADAAPRFRGLDICGFGSAFFRPPSPDPTVTVPGISPEDPIRGALHPNAVGQGIYAAVLAGRLYS
jgi:hypothetical protein